MRSLRCHTDSEIELCCVSGKVFSIYAYSEINMKSLSPKHIHKHNSVSLSMWHLKLLMLCAVPSQLDKYHMQKWKHKSFGIT